ncbi:MAG: cytochrome b/b6 domain-containing protein [Geminicoccaceae bacterium]
MIDASSQGYGGIARVFHWLTALLILALFALGWYMTDLEPSDPSTFNLYQIHKSIGVTVFTLALLRLAWRLTHKAPPWPEHMATWERFAATGAHWALYGLILLQPLLGVLQSNAANFPIVFWGHFELPALIGPSETLDYVLKQLHHLLANALAGLVLLHVGAALRHHIQLKDSVLRNMLPSATMGIGVVALTLAFVVPPFLLMGQLKPSTTAGEGDDVKAGAPATEATDDFEPVGVLWSIEEDSKLGFIALQQGSAVEGSFDSFDAKIVFDPDDLENSQIKVDIDVTSITTGHSDRDQTLNSASFFDTNTWPSAAFVSRGITAIGDGSYEAAGTLAMRDVVKDVVLAFTLVIEKDPAGSGQLKAHAKGELPIKRLDYGIGQGDWASTGTVADEVTITVDIKATRP